MRVAATKENKISNSLEERLGKFMREIPTPPEKSYKDQDISKYEAAMCKIREPLENS